MISGDFTQRARVRQYQLACDFVERLEAAGHKLLCVPGNHDVPLYDVVRRFVRPLHRYRRFIDDDLCPWFENDELAVLGINTARSLTIKDGSISLEQMATIRDSFRETAPGKIEDPGHPSPACSRCRSATRASSPRSSSATTDALTAVAEAGVQILLAGHFHRTYAQSAREMVETAGPALVIQAGTATSTRLRGDELQSFNWIEAAPDRVELQVQRWDGSAFVRRPADHVHLRRRALALRRPQGGVARGAGSRQRANRPAMLK